MTHNEIKSALESGAHHVTFTKKDGTVRTMLCTREFSLLAENADEFGFVAPKTAENDEKNTLPENMLRVWSLESNGGWRTINTATVTEVRADA